jgi:hypothetical protein
VKIFLHLGEPFWRAAGKREIEITLNDGESISHALVALAQIHPSLAKDLDGREAKPMMFVDDEEALPERILSEGAKVHVVWPVSGGQSYPIIHAKGNYSRYLAG